MLADNPGDGPPSAPRDKRRPGLIYTETPDIERRVFICGLHKSGTTMLEAYLFAHYDLSALRGLVSENEGQHLQSVYSPASAFGGPGRFAFDPKLYQELESLADHAACRARLSEQWNHFVVGESRTLLEKSPPNLTKIGWLRRVFPGSLFIIVVRDPRAVSVAMRKWLRTSISELMSHWDVAHAVALKELGEDCLILKYEDFCRDQGKTLWESGINAVLRRRSIPRPIDPRYAQIGEQNGSYLERFDWKPSGGGAWLDFGYTF